MMQWSHSCTSVYARYSSQQQGAAASMATRSRSSCGAAIAIWCGCISAECGRPGKCRSPCLEPVSARQQPGPQAGQVRPHRARHAAAERGKVASQRGVVQRDEVLRSILRSILHIEIKEIRGHIAHRCISTTRALLRARRTTETHLQAREEPQRRVRKALEPAAHPAAAQQRGQRLEAALVQRRGAGGAAGAQAGGRKQLDEGEGQVRQE